MRFRWALLAALMTVLALIAGAVSRGVVEAQQAPAEPAAPLAPTGAAAQPAPSGPSASAGQLVQETIVQGTVPDLAGRWMALGWVDLPGGRQTTIPTFWEVTTTDGKPVLTQKFVDLPAPLKEGLDKSNTNATLWRPSADDLAKLAGSWDSLTKTDSHVAHVKSDISGSDAFDDSIKNEPRSKDSKWVVRQRWDFDGKAGALNRQVMVYSVLDQTGQDYTGNFDSAMVASAPFPIPISFKGTFRLYRLGDEAAPRGFFARLADMFAGCGRR